MKKKKRKVLSKKEKIIIFCAGALAFLIILSLALMPTKKNNKEKVNPEDIDLNKDLETVQDVVEYLESDFISMEDSKTDGYDIDIYLNFKYDLYEENISKEPYFKNFYEKIAMVTNFKSFRLIDSSKKITIEVKCTSNGISEVKINGDINYYKNQTSKNSKANELKVEMIDLKVNSEILQNLINAKWNTSNVNLGSKESQYEKYDIYFDEGYRVRTIKGKVFNIIFTNKYKKAVVGDYKVGESLETIEAALGTSYKNTGILGYKTDTFYVIFTADEISIYPNYQYDYTEFENLVKEYDEKKDINDFMDKLTDIWPDYDSYLYDTNYVSIDYVLKGVKINFTSSKKDGIQIYENYQGDLKYDQKKYTDVYYKIDENLLMKNESKRLMAKMYDNTGIEYDPIHYSNKFYLFFTVDNERYKNIKIKSLDEKYPDNEFGEEVVITSYVWADDSHLIYGIANDGLYVYDAEERKNQKILSGEDLYKITGYDRGTNIIEYDDTKARINF